MTNMSISQGDYQMLAHAIDRLLERRKQLAPYPFDHEQTLQLYMPPPVYTAVKKLRDLGPSFESMFQKSRIQNVYVRGVTQKPLQVSLVVKPGSTGHDLIVMGNNFTTETVYAVKSVPHYEEFHAWCTEAVKVEAINQHVDHVLQTIIRKLTTYKQFHLALPETLKAISAYTSTAHAKDQWAYRHNISKFNDIYNELRDTSSSRARKLHPELKEYLDKNRHHVERVMAMAVLLPAHDGCNKDSQFDPTWVRMRMPKND